jgi:hypothetical protein
LKKGRNDNEGNIDGRDLQKFSENNQYQNGKDTDDFFCETEVE